MGSVRVLLAEDHVVVREGIRELIQREEGMEIVGEAGDGEEAVQLAERLKPDIILMDISMPKLNGIEATQRIKGLHPSISVLVLTAYDNEEFILALLEAGAAGYLLKNVRSRELINAIRAVYDGESVLHPVIANKVFSRLQLGKRKHSEQERGELLTDRELEVLRLGTQGLANKEIATGLFLGERTIQTHWRNIFNKLGVSSRTEAIMYCLRKGWISMNQEEE
ncbi:MAG: response regulator transcription factor [Dehalococcoidia bacterium]|nr:response regulator transcription factor [Dehalococcoidia bacterium]